MYIRVDTTGNPWEGTARYMRVPTPQEVREAMQTQPAHIVNAIIKKYGGDVLATRRPDLISKHWVVREGA